MALEQGPGQPELAPKNKAEERKEFLKSLLGVEVDSPKVMRDLLRAEVEQKAERKEKSFRRSKYKLKKKDAEELKDFEAQDVISSVDSKGFEMTWHSPDWYKDYVDSAKYCEKIAGKFDDNTKQWFNALKPVIDGFAKLSDLNPRDYRNTCKNEIWKLVKQYGGKSVYDAKGALNFLLAVNRLRESGVNPESVNLRTVKLVLGTAKDSKNAKNDRFVVLVKSKEPVLEPPVDPVVDPPVVPPEPDGGKKVPEMGTPEFYARYEIPEKNRVKFDAKVKSFETWINNPEKYNLLTDPKVLQMQPGEPESAFNTRMSKLFGHDNGELKALFDDLDGFVFLYEKFMQDVSNPKSVAIGKLFLDVSKRMIEYTDKFVAEEAPRTLALLRYHEAIMEGCSSLRGVASIKQSVLRSLIASATYLETNDPDDGDEGRVKWKRLKEQYQAELSAR